MDAPEVAATDFILNIAPIHFEDAPLHVGVLQYKDCQHLAALRAQHALTHVLHQDSAGRLLAVPIVPDAPLLGAKSKEIRLQDNLALCATLIRHALLSYLWRKGRLSLGYDPLRIVGNASNDNLLAATTPFGCPSWLAIRPVYDLVVRMFHFDLQVPVVGLALDLRTQPIIDLSGDELMAQGVDLAGLSVGQRIDQEDVRLAPHFETLGQVAGVDRGDCS